MFLVFLIVGRMRFFNFWFYFGNGEHHVVFNLKSTSILCLQLNQCGPRLRAWRAALRFEKASRAAKIKSRSGWSNFSTLVGHIFEKLFEFARLNRIKTLIFVSKSGCSLKKKVFTWNRSAKFLFSFQNQGVL